MLQEWHYFFENTRRWRNLRKITIAQVHGTVYAAGLMLMWACDLIVAAEDVTFADVVGTRLGMCGIEYFAHPWEFGPRKTKELMLTGDSIERRRGAQLGMVSKVFPRRRAGRQDAGVRPPDRQAAHDGRAAHQGVGQPDAGQHGLLQLAQCLLTPLTPRADNVQHRIDHSPTVDRRTPATRCPREQPSNQLPLSISQIAGILQLRLHATAPSYDWRHRTGAVALFLQSSNFKTRS